MNQQSIFVSHGTKYAYIANSLKRSLLRVKSTRPKNVVRPARHDIFAGGNNLSDEKNTSGAKHDVSQ